MKDPILITGMPRSGTSLTAGVLAHCGAFTGDTWSPMPPEANPLGFFENTSLFQRKPPNISADRLPKPHEIQQLANWQRFVRLTLEAQGFREDQTWLVKRPNFHSWYAWHHVFPNARWVIVRRDDEGIKKSLDNMFHMAFTENRKRARWFDNENEYNNCKQVLSDIIATVPPQNLFELWPGVCLQDPGHTRLKELVAFAGLEWTSTAEEFITPPLWERPNI